jgi:Protein of unknown function (DUF935)
MPRSGRPPKNLNEIGFSGLRHSGGFVKEDFIIKLQGPLGQKRLREMAENDSTIGGILFAMESIIMQSGWQVVRGGTRDIDNKAAQFLQGCMVDMSHTWEDFVSGILTVLKFGWSYFEVVYKIRNGKANDPKYKSRYEDNKFGWRKFGFRAQETLFKWEFDSSGGIQGMWQMADFYNVDNKKMFQPQFIPIDKAILFRTKHEKNNPEGRAITRTAYRAYKIKKVLEELEAIGIERDLVGFPMLMPPESFDLNDPDNDDVKNWAQDLITHIKRDEQEGAVIPFGWELKLLGSPGNRQFNISETIDRWDKRIAMSMLGQFIMLGMDRTGSYALSDTQNDLFMLAMVGWIESIAQTINRHAVEPLMRLNPEFDSIDVLPSIEPVRPTPPNLEELSNYLFKLSRAGLVVPDEELADFLRKLAFIKETPSSKDIRVVDPVSQKTPKPVPGDTGPKNMNPLGSANPNQPAADNLAGGGN